MSQFIHAITDFIAALPAQIKSEKKGIYRFEYVVAERKTFLSRKKLVYQAKFRLDDDGLRLCFNEMLKETGFGLVSGTGDLDSGPGTGFKKGAFKSGLGGLEGVIEEQSRLWGKKYSYTFDLGKIRRKFQDIARDNGYSFEYHVVGLGK